MDTVLVAHELTAYLEDDGVFSSLDVVPREPKNLSATKSERQRQHVRSLVTMTLDRTKELLRLFGRQAPTTALVQFRPFRD
ncbi:MAG: hypothetical protein KGJ42_06315 [Acidobacteriota bacterium]|nr:hypothetical protein [Acidobacteriota bacterium]MDE3107752.1 hypothetical protein [Acidobacteriota bacterium]MDE3222604.1 hypothetical protein [Acidobacteriota bacterium]